MWILTILIAGVGVQTWGVPGETACQRFLGAVAASEAVAAIPPEDIIMTCTPLQMPGTPA
jgi:hypothetical protein